MVEEVKRGGNKSTPVLIRNRKPLAVDVQKTEEEIRKRNHSKPVLIKNRKPLPVMISNEAEKVNPDDFIDVISKPIDGVSEILANIQTLIQDQLEEFRKFFEHQRETEARGRANDSLASDDNRVRPRADDPPTDKRSFDPFGLREMHISDVMKIASIAFLAIQTNTHLLIAAASSISYYMTGLAAGLSKVKKIISAAFAPLRKTMWVANLIGKVASTIVGIAKSFLMPILNVMGVFLKWVPILNVVIAVYEAMKGFISAYAETGSIWQGIKRGLGNVFHAFISLPLDLLRKGLAWLMDTFGFHGIGNTLRNFSFKDTFDSIGVWLEESALSVFTYLKDAFVSIIDSFKNTDWSFIYDLMKLSMFGGFINIINIGTKIWDFLDEYFWDTLDWLKENLSFAKIMERIQKAWDDFWNGDDSVVKQAREAIESERDRAMKETYKEMEESGPIIFKSGEERRQIEQHTTKEIMKIIEEGKEHPDPRVNAHANAIVINQGGTNVRHSQSNTNVSTPRKRDELDATPSNQ